MSARCVTFLKELKRNPAFKTQLMALEAGVLGDLQEKLDEEEITMSEIEAGTLPYMRLDLKVEDI